MNYGAREKVMSMLLVLLRWSESWEALCMRDKAVF